VINVVAAISTVGREHGMGWRLWIGGAFLALRAGQAASGLPALVPFTQGLWVVGCMLGMLATARHALRGGAVDAERIFAALDAYLLAGLVFGMCYWLLGRVDPVAFNETDLSLARATYFSFVTLATLGYGDIVPRRELAQSLAIVEAVGGQMYLAVLIARLVSLYSRQAEM
jgi:Ion channel